MNSRQGTLKQRWDSHILQAHKVKIRFLMILSGLLAIGVGFLVLVPIHALNTRVSQYRRLASAVRLDQHATDSLELGISVMRRLFYDVLLAGVGRYLILGSSLALLLAFAYFLIESRIIRYLFKSPALVEQCLEWAHTDLCSTKERHRIFFSVTVLLTVAYFAVPRLRNIRPYSATLIVVAILMCVYVWWAHRRIGLGRGAKWVTVDFIKRLCILDVLHVFVLVIASVVAIIFLSNGAIAAKSRIDRSLEVAMSDISVLEDRLTSAVESRGNVVESIVDECRHMYERISISTRPGEGGLFLISLSEPQGVRDFLSTVIVIAGILAYLHVGALCIRLDYVKPLLALFLTFGAVVAIHYLIGGVQALADRAGLARGYVQAAMVLFAYVLGQITSLFIRSGVSGGIRCPRCGSECRPDFSLCGTCGTNVDRVYDAPLYGNPSPRSMQLHHRSCATIRSLVSSSRAVVFMRAEDAYWEDYDNCGLCLGGSQSGSSNKRLVGTVANAPNPQP